MPVTRTERREGESQERDKINMERVAAGKARELAARIRTVVRRFGQSGGDLRGMLWTAIMEHVKTLVDTAVASHLKGMRRTELETGIGLSQSLTEAVAAQRRILKLTPADIDRIRQQYEIESLRLGQDLFDNVWVSVQTAAQQAIAEGQTVRTGTATIEKAMVSAGYHPSNPYAAEAMYRTQVNVAYGAARWESSQTGPVGDILWGYKYVTVGDDRVRESHRGFDGVTLPKDHPLWSSIWPPNGWGCRCSTIELFDEREIVLPDADAAPDPGFSFNAGQAITV